jgi:hypothetical protein
MLDDYEMLRCGLQPLREFLPALGMFSCDALGHRGERDSHLRSGACSGAIGDPRSWCGHECCQALPEAVLQSIPAAQDRSPTRQRRNQPNH